MDVWVIILIVLIFVIIYAMYVITKTASLIKGVVPLKSLIEIQAIDNGTVKIPSPTSQNYYYEAWVYLTDAKSATLTDGTSTTSSTVSTILGRLNTKDDVALSVFEKSDKYTLCVLSGTTTTATPHFVTEDFPTNKWVYLVMNVSGKLVEVYVNGKLLRTIYLPTSVPRSNDASINIGGTGLDGYITRAIRKPENIDPTKVWDQYLSGNGQYGGALYGLIDYINAYAFKMNITSNGKIQRQFTAQIGSTETK